MSSPTHWSLPFLQPRNESPASRTALIVLNQPFSKALLHRLWHATDWHCCADGGANRLHDLLSGDDDNSDTTTIASVAGRLTGWIADLLSRFMQQQPRRSSRRRTSKVDDYLPDLLKGDLDSVREDVRRYYETRVSWYSKNTFHLQKS